MLPESLCKYCIHARSLTREYVKCDLLGIVEPKNICPFFEEAPEPEPDELVYEEPDPLFDITEPA